MRKYALMASSVVASEEFISMSYKAQALYVQILCETETSGEVVNIARVVRATGFGTDALDELYSCGFLLKVGQTTVVRHQWVNNKTTGKAWSCMDSFKPYQDGSLVFEDKEGNSPYRLGDTEETPERHPKDTEQLPNGTQGNAEVNSNGTGTCTGNGTEQSQGEGESKGEGEDLHPCWCPRCKNVHATYTTVNHRTTIHCPDCGDFENRRESDSEGYSLWNE